jgi:hypothetical protein
LILPNQIKNNELVPFEIRLATTDDIHFITNSWLLSTKHQYPNQYALDFAKHYTEYLSKLTSRSISLVAHLQEEPSEILSYLVYTSFRKNMVVHFAYSKVDARNQGIVRNLLQFANPEKLPIVFTHPAKNENLMQHFARKWIFDPSVIQLLMEITA